MLQEVNDLLARKIDFVSLGSQLDLSPGGRDQQRANDIDTLIML
jgi:hypothetical protein